MADISTYQATGSAMPGARKLLGALFGDRQPLEAQYEKSLYNIDYLRAHADQARAAAELNRQKAATESAKGAPIPEADFQQLLQYGANTGPEVASQYVAQQTQPTMAGPYNIPEDVVPRLARTAFAIQAAHRDLGNLEQVAKGQGSLQEQQLTDEAVRAGDAGDRNRLVTRLEVMAHRPETFSSNREGVLNAATGRLDTGGALTQADIRAQDALARQRDEHAKSIKTGGSAATARMQVYRHATDDLGMSDEEALQFTRSMFGAKADMSTAEIGRRRYDAVLKATGSTKQAETAERAITGALDQQERTKNAPPPASKVQSTGEGAKQMREHIDLQGPAGIDPKDAKAVETLRGIKTDRARLKATVQMLQQQGYSRSQIETLLQKAGVPQ